MRGSWKITLFVTLLALGAAGAAVLYVTNDWLVAVGVRVAIDRYNTRVNSTLTVQDVSIDLFPLTVTVRGLSITARGHTPLNAPLHVKQATAKVRWWPLLKRRIVLDELRISEASVRVELDAQNRLNFEELFRLVVDDNPDKPSPWNVVIRDFKLHQTHVNVAIEDLPAHTMLSEVAIQGSLVLEPLHLHAELINGEGEITYRFGGDRLRYRLLQTTAGLDLFKDRLQIHHWRAAGKEFTLAGQGLLENFKHPRLAAQFGAEVALPVLAALAPELPPTHGMIAVKGSLEGSVKSPQLRLTAQAGRLGLGPYTVSEMSASLSLAQTRLRIEQLTLGFLGGTLQGAGTLELRLPQSPQPRIDVQLEVANLPLGDLLQLGGFAAPLLDGRVAGRAVIESPSFDPDLMRVQGSLALVPLPTQIPAASQSLPLPISLTTGFRYEERTLVLENTAWALNGAKGEMSGRLTLDGAAQLSGTLQAEVSPQTLAPLGAPPAWGKLKLAFTVHGNIRDPSLEADLEVQNARYQGLHFDHLRTVLKAKQSDVKIIALRGTQGSARYYLAGEVKLSTPFTQLRLTSAGLPIQAIPALQVQVERLDLAALAPWLAPRVPLAGELSLKARVSGPWPTLSGEGHLDIRGLAVQGEHLGDVSLVVAGSPTQATLKQLLAKIGGGQVQAKGVLTFPRQIDMTVEWQDVRLERLAILYGKHVPAVGALSGTARARGAWPELSAEVSLRGPRLRAAGADITDLHLQATVSPREVVLSRVTSRVEGARLTGAGRAVWGGALDIHLSSEEIPLRSVKWLPEGLPLAGRVRLELMGSGTLEHPTLRGQVHLTSVRVSNMTLGTGALAFSLDGRRLTFATTGLERFSGNGEVTLDQTLPAQVRLAVRSLDIGLVAAYLGSGVADRLIEGEVSGSIEVNGHLRSLPSLVGSIVLEPVRLRSNGVELRNVAPLRWQLAKGVLTFAAVRLRGQGANLDLRGTVNLLDDSLDIAVLATSPLAMIGARIPGLRFYQGTLDTQLNLKGRLRQPTFDGQVVVRDGVINIPAVNASLSQLQGEIQFAEQTIAIPSLHGKLAGGDVKVSGELGLQGFQLHQISLSAQAHQVRLRFPADFFALLDAEVVITGNSQAQQVIGEVGLARARYRQEIDLVSLIRQYRQRAIEPPLAHESPQLDIRLYTMDRLRVDNRVAKAELMADLRVRGTPNRPVVLGRVDIEKGTADVAGSRFTGVVGSIDFLNPIQTEPFFDIAADTQKNGYRIHVTVTGTPQQLDVHATSEPALSEMDILALLTVGATGQAITTGARAVLPGPVSAFLTGQLAEEIGRGVGTFVGVDRLELEPVAVEAQRVGGPQVTVGKNFGKDLSVTYTTILGSTREDLVTVEYRITDSISVLGVRDEKGDVGVDLKFSFRFE